ncbi:hypothetical protein ACOZ4J_27290 [Pseudomonas syringae pv. actinidiae]|uniref:hypothetical protein n=1 Tax=Pseudomonas syringae TaxID=317 RepID=UPI003DA997B8
MPTTDCPAAVPDEIQVLCHIGSISRAISPVIGHWAATVTFRLASSTTGKLKVLVWPGLHAGREFLSVDINGVTESYCLTFMMGLAHNFAIDDVAFPDMTEAFIMATIVPDKIQAEVTLHA